MRAILFTLSKASGFGLDKVLFLSGSLEVDRAISRSNDWSLRSLVVDIVDATRSFDGVIFWHIPRVLNGAAHSFDKYCFVSDNECEWFYYFLGWLGTVF